MMKIFWFFEMIFYFIYQLLLANWNVLKLLFISNEKIYPAIIAFDLDPDLSDFQIWTLASMITLTPGTLSIDVSENKEKLFIHVIHCENIDDLKNEIKNGFCSRVKRALKGRT